MERLQQALNNFCQTISQNPKLSHGGCPYCQHSELLFCETKAHGFSSILWLVKNPRPFPLWFFTFSKAILHVLQLLRAWRFSKLSTVWALGESLANPSTKLLKIASLSSKPQLLGKVGLTCSKTSDSSYSCNHSCFSLSLQDNQSCGVLIGCRIILVLP